MSEAPSIYRSPDHAARAAKFYDEWLARFEFPLESVYVDTPAGRTHLLVTGPEDAPPLMFVHGVYVNALFCVQACPAQLRERYRCYFVDVPGNSGRSEGKLPDFNDGSFGRWMEAVLDGVGVERVGLVGVSMGALVTLHTCVQISHRVSRAAFLVPAGFVPMGFSWRTLKLIVCQLRLGWWPKRANARRFIAASMRPGRVVDEHLVEAIEVVFATLKPLSSDVPVPVPVEAEALAGFRGPSLVIAGELDEMFAGEPVVARAREVLHEPRTVLIADGHMGAGDCDEARAELVRFMTETDEEVSTRPAATGARVN